MGLPSSVKRIFAEFGRRGGETRARRLSAEERQKAARKAARVRWARVKVVRERKGVS